MRRSDQRAIDQTSSGGGLQNNVAAEYRAQQEASRLKLARLLQRREENMVGCIEDLERELLISCQMAERDERLRGRLIALQGQFVLCKRMTRELRRSTIIPLLRELKATAMDTMSLPRHRKESRYWDEAKMLNDETHLLVCIDMRASSAMVDGDGRVSDAPS